MGGRKGFCICIVSIHLPVHVSHSRPYFSAGHKEGDQKIEHEPIEQKKDKNPKNKTHHAKVVLQSIAHSKKGGL